MFEQFMLLYYKEQCGSFWGLEPAELIGLDHIYPLNVALPLSIGVTKTTIF